MAGIIERSTSAVQRVLKRPADRRGIAIMVAFCIALTMAAWIVPAPAGAFNDDTSGVAPIAPVKPQLTATAIVPQQVGFCRNFNFNVTVINYGNAPAKNAHLFFNQFPGGFFTIVSMDHLSSPISEYNEDILLGDLKENEQRDINFVVYVPFQKTLNADWSRRFYFNFTASHDYVAEELMGRIMFLAGNGKIQVQKTGFTQQ